MYLCWSILLFLNHTPRLYYLVNLANVYTLFLLLRSRSFRISFSRTWFNDLTRLFLFLLHLFLPLLTFIRINDRRHIFLSFLLLTLFLRTLFFDFSLYFCLGFFWCQFLLLLFLLFKILFTRYESPKVGFNRLNLFLILLLNFFILLWLS